MTILIKTWPTNRIDHMVILDEHDAMDRFSSYIAAMPDDAIHTHGGIEGRLLEAIPGVVIPHMDPIDPSCARDEWDALVTAARKIDRKSTRLNSSHVSESRMPSSA